MKVEAINNYKVNLDKGSFTVSEVALNTKAYIVVEDDNDPEVKYVICEADTETGLDNIHDAITNWIIQSDHGLYDFYKCGFCGPLMEFKADRDGVPFDVSFAGEHLAGEIGKIFCDSIQRTFIISFLNLRKTLADYLNPDYEGVRLAAPCDLLDNIGFTKIVSMGKIGDHEGINIYVTSNKGMDLLM